MTDPFGPDPFKAPSADPMATPFQPIRQKRKPLPDQHEWFVLQKQFKKVGDELARLEADNRGVDTRHLRSAYDTAWKKLVAQLQEWAR